VGNKIKKMLRRVGSSNGRVEEVHCCSPVITPEPPEEKGDQGQPEMISHSPAGQQGAEKDTAVKEEKNVFYNPRGKEVLEKGSTDEKGGEKSDVAHQCEDKVNKR